jgi:hypothetical protein
MCSRLFRFFLIKGGAKDKEKTNAHALNFLWLLSFFQEKKVTTHTYNEI